MQGRRQQSEDWGTRLVGEVGDLRWGQTAWKAGVHLLGASDRLRRTISAFPSPTEASLISKHSAIAKSALGGKFVSGFEEGGRLELVQAIGIARRIVDSVGQRVDAGPRPVSATR